jgi:hypothetical protein
VVITLGSFPLAAAYAVAMAKLAATGITIARRLRRVTRDWCKLAMTRARVNRALVSSAVVSSRRARVA